jgi:pimeloyl-ACP methyl ester carboxylesterase
MRFLTVDGVRLEYRRIFPDPQRLGSPMLMLLHEGLGCVGLWKDFPDRLAKATGLGVFLWSRAGFGRSDPIALPRPLDYLERETELIPEVLAAAGIGPAVLVGHSDGGTIALVHAASGRAESLEGIVTMAAHVFVEDVTIAGIRETKRAWEEGGLRDRLARWHGANVDAAFHGWCDVWLDPAFRGWNIERHLSAVRVPVLAIQGARSIRHAGAGRGDRFAGVGPGGGAAAAGRWARAAPRPAGRGHRGDQSVRSRARTARPSGCGATVTGSSSTRPLRTSRTGRVRPMDLRSSSLWMASTDGVG